MLTNEAFLNQLIKNHYKVAQEMTVAALVQVALAIVTLLVLSGIKEETSTKFMGVLGGGGIYGGLGIITVKEILERREKARILESARPLLQEVQQPLTLGEPIEQQRMKEAFLKLIEKTISS